MQFSDLNIGDEFTLAYIKDRSKRVKVARDAYECTDPNQEPRIVSVDKIGIGDVNLVRASSIETVAPDIDNATTAQRFANGKPRYDLIPLELLEGLAKMYAELPELYLDPKFMLMIIREVALVSTKGAVKYSKENWKKSIGKLGPSSEFREGCYRAAMSHLIKHRKGEYTDDEVVIGAENIDTLHLAHGIWNLAAPMYYDFEEDFDPDYARLINATERGND